MNKKDVHMYKAFNMNFDDPREVITIKDQKMISWVMIPYKVKQYNRMSSVSMLLLNMMLSAAQVLQRYRLKNINIH